MKTCALIGLSIVCSITLTCSSQQTYPPALSDNEPSIPEKDIRVAGAGEVDLAPVHQWLAKPVGDRPLKHWKRLQLLELKDNVGGYARCVVNTEQKAKTELLIANLPPGPVAFLKSAKQQYAAILSMRAQVAADQKAIDAHVDWDLSHPPTWSTFTSGSTSVSDTPRSRTQAYVAATRKLEEDQKNLRLLEVQYQGTQQKALAQTSVLAMFTGQSYANKQIWDCGKKR